MSGDSVDQINTDFKMRGDSMTRIETFVAAAFAFAVTMLIISLEEIPENFDEFVMSIKQIPAFAAGCASIIWIWHTHAKWSRRYGLEDGATIFLSGCLIFLVLIYIYPLKLMMQALFSSISGGYLPMKINFTAVWHVRLMFAFYAIGLLFLCFNFIGLYCYALKKRVQLNLSQHELFDTRSEILLWTATSVVCVISLALALILPDNLLGLAGYVFFLLFPVLIGQGFYLKRKRNGLFQPSSGR